ncbi:IS3 family transposase [Methylovulum psychrotolerans]|nr:IS3 family transposase [Methylovulum psychrotolerans]
MSVSTSAYYDWAKQPTDTGKILEKQKLRERAQTLFDASKRSYGSRRLSDGLKKAGFPVGRYKARRVMAELSSSGFSSIVYLAVHDFKCPDGLLLMSNFCCLPGRAGGFPIIG